MLVNCSWIFYVNTLASLWIIALSIRGAISNTMECCKHVSKAKYTPCKDVCEQLWMSRGPLQQMEIFSTAYRHCPINDLLTFWQCIGANYPVLTEIESWEGRSCCELAYSSDCQLACQTANSITDLKQRCSLDSEKTLYACVDRQTGSQQCCPNIMSTQCKAACRAMFAGETSSADATLTSNLDALCTGSNSYVHQCIQNWTQQQQQQQPPTSSSHATSIQCCSKGANTMCKQTCVTAFTGMRSQDDIMKTLIPVCGQPESTEPFWQCFLLSEADSNRGRSSDIKKLPPLDSASLQCCSKAVSTQCRSLCIQLYDRKLSSVWESFSSACKYNTNELSMMTCLQDVKAPCKVGCKQLDFCSNFNNRFDISFRSCNKEADVASRREYSSWLRNKRIQLPSTMTVPIKDIRTCEPAMWKAISCALNVKPCNAQGSHGRICKADCISVLDKCVDNSERSYNTGALCDQLLVSDDEKECISLLQFIEPSFVTETEIDLSNPCVPNPCNKTQLCEVNQNYPQCQETHRSCQPFVCRSSCRIGENSPVRVKSNQLVKIIDLKSNSDLNCYNVCKCGHHSMLTRCQNSYCDQSDSCVFYSTTSVVEHGTLFNMNCNKCICHQGETICSRQHCPISQQTSGGSCGCPLSYSQFAQ
ncbi:RECK [Bugula neritina]|uniref:RECK n=1 Tax=Bugula neritina TaxID=10212 RepID=A0A7J7JD80_BUGNE|nr:RECK [Bugula neritina]